MVLTGLKKVSAKQSCLQASIACKAITSNRKSRFVQFIYASVEKVVNEIRRLNLRKAPQSTDISVKISKDNAVFFLLVSVI